MLSCKGFICKCGPIDGAGLGRVCDMMPNADRGYCATIYIKRCVLHRIMAEHRTVPLLLTLA
jgi:hypothetical protein